MSLLCIKCGDYYKIDEQCSVCPHEPFVYAGPVYGWLMPPEAEKAMDEAYRNDDRDGIRIYYGHSNPLVRRYAEDKIAALDMARELRDQSSVYETSSQLDGPMGLSPKIYHDQKKSQ